RQEGALAGRVSKAGRIVAIDDQADRGQGQSERAACATQKPVAPTPLGVGGHFLNLRDNFDRGWRRWRPSFLLPSAYGPPVHAVLASKGGDGGHRHRKLLRVAHVLPPKVAVDSLLLTGICDSLLLTLCIV